MKRSRLVRTAGRARKSRMRVEPYSTGIDVRGDRALFIPVGANLGDSDLINALKERVIHQKGFINYIDEHGVLKKKVASVDDPVFFRLINALGEQMPSHGWIRYNRKTGKAEITQWG